jgi:signal transduction histidine kinase
MAEMTVFAKDITKRVTAEKSIMEMSEELRIIIDSTEDFIGSVDRDYRIILFNSAWSDYMECRFGCRLERGARLMDLIPPQYAAVWSELFERAVSEGKYQIEIKIDEGTRVMSYSFNPVYIDGQVAEITVFGKEITERLNSEREIIRLNSSLEKRVLERTEELQKSINDLRNLSNIISHDLKGPIRQIEHHAKRIKTLTQSGDIRADISEIEKTCERMTRLIVSLSEYAMSSEFNIRKEAVNVKKMVTTIYNELKAGALNGTLLQFETGLPVVCADRVLLQHVISNLLSNALKFSSKREISEITAGCMEDNGYYVFYIRDNGVGFDMQYAHKLFNVFERLHADEGYEGSGIGLAAVRNIVRRHGGMTWIESKENTGTTVYFTLPTKRKGDSFTCQWR